MKGTKGFRLFAVALLGLSGIAMADTVALQHIHGLAYGADGKALYVASHHGLVTYQDGRWSVMAGPPHDHMGFSATRKYFYSSGPRRARGLPIRWV